MKMNRAICLCHIVILMSISSVVYSQNTASISGKIVDSQSKSPLQMTNVFLSGTSYGTATNLLGEFAIDNIYPRKYELIISMIGYKNQKIAVDLLTKEHVKLDVNLELEPLELKEVTVVAEEPIEWKNNLKLFKKYFFGKSKFATDCIITNPEVLDFEIQKGNNPNKTRMLVTASQPFIFLNNALGYKVQCHINRLIFPLYKGERFYIQDNMVSYASFTIDGDLRFTDLDDKNQKQCAEWRRNRKIAFNGSLRHFLYSLANSCTESEGFQILNVNTNELIDPQSIVTYDKNRNEYNLDLNGPDFNDEDGGHIGFSVVIVLNKNRTFQVLRLDYQKSLLGLRLGRSLSFDNNGLIKSDPLNISYWEYWVWAFSGAEWLPDDYVPADVYLIK